MKNAKEIKLKRGREGRRERNSNKRRKDDRDKQKGFRNDRSQDRD